MSDLLTNLGLLFTFLFTQLGNFATFFTSSVLGQVILGIVIFGVVTSIVMVIFHKIIGR